MKRPSPLLMKAYVEWSYRTSAATKTDATFIYSSLTARERCLVANRMFWTQHGMRVCSQSGEGFLKPANLTSRTVSSEGVEAFFTSAVSLRRCWREKDSFFEGSASVRVDLVSVVGALLGVEMAHWAGRFESEWWVAFCSASCISLSSSFKIMMLMTAQQL